MWRVQSRAVYNFFPKQSINGRKMKKKDNRRKSIDGNEIDIKKY